MEILGERGSALAKDQAPASLTTWLRPHEETEENKIPRNISLKYRIAETNRRTRLDKVIITGTQRPQRRLRHRAEARAERLRAPRSLRATCDKNRSTIQVGTGNANKNRGSRNVKTYNKNRARYNKWIENKGWWGTTADNRVPPRGTVGEPRHISGMNANMVSNHARDKSAASKPFDRPRGSVMIQKQNTSEKKRIKRGKRSNEARLRRIEQRTQKRIESRRLYMTFRETIPKEEWRLARPTHQDSRALKAGGTDKNKTWGSRHWNNNWHSQNEPVKYGDETRVNALKWRYAEELKVASLNVRGMREITKREQVITHLKKNSIDLLCLQETKPRVLA